MRIKNVLLIILFSIVSGQLAYSADEKHNTTKSAKVLFIANYMNVFGPASKRGAQTTQGHDFFPLIRREGTSLETMQAEIQAMRKYGFNAIQAWPDYNSSVGWLKAVEKMKLSEPFYVFPQIGAGVVRRFFPDYKSFVKATVAFLKKYADHPNLLRINNLPVLSSWGGVVYLKDLKKFRRDVNRHGVDFFWLTTIDTAVTHPNMRKLSRVRANGYDAYNSWRSLHTLKDIVKIRKFMNSDSYKCLIFGTIFVGYDNRNRIHSNNYRLYNGAETYIKSLNAGLDGNLNRMILATWNDIAETACMPSWRSPGGYEFITRFYRGIYDQAGSPFHKSQLVVAYQPEQLLGDMIRIQFILLPDQKKSNWSGRLELRNINDKVIFSQNIALAPERNDRAMIRNIDFPSLKMPNDCVVLSPCIVSNGRTKRLSPLIIRTDRMRSMPPLVIALDKVVSPLENNVAFVNDASRMLATAAPVKIRVTVKAPNKIRQLQLADSTQILLDAELAVTNKILLFPAFDVWKFDNKLELELENAKFRWLHQYPDKKTQNKLIVSRLNGKKLNISFGNGTGFKRRAPVAVTAVETATPDKAFLIVRGPKIPNGEKKFKLLDLASAPAFVINSDNDGIVRLRLAEDGHSLPEMKALNSSEISLYALLPNIEHNEPYRVIFSEGELADGRVFYSRPLLWIRSDNPETQIKAQVVNSKKAFDDTLIDGLTVSPNYFKAEDVKQVKLPIWRFPVFNLNFNEGRGLYVNDGGCYASRGFAWLTRNAVRKQSPAWDKNALDKSGMRFKPSSKLNLRSGSMPTGSFSFICWIKFDKPIQSGRIFSDCHFSIKIQKNGTISMRLRKNSRNWQKINSKTSFEAGKWQQLAITYDLLKIRIFINGKIDAEVETPPLQSRLHSIAFFGAASKADLGFSGIIDEALITGYALPAEKIKNNFKCYRKLTKQK